MNEDIAKHYLKTQTKTKMSKIIKPKVNPDGDHEVKQLEHGDYYLENGLYHEYRSIVKSVSIHGIYYAEEWRPALEGFYWAWSFLTETSSFKMNSSSNGSSHDTYFSNCFQTQAEAEDVNNILKVLDNMKKYYEEKLKGEKENGK